MSPPIYVIGEKKPEKNSDLHVETLNFFRLLFPNCNFPNWWAHGENRTIAYRVIFNKHFIYRMSQENPSLDVFPKPNHSFKKDYKLECIDPKHPSYICVCTIVKVKGARLRLHFDGWSESYDFWTNVDSPLIFPMHWCEKNGQILHPPRSKSF